VVACLRLGRGPQGLGQCDRDGALPPGTAVFGHYRRENPASDIELGYQPNEPRRGGGNQVTEYFVGHCFVKCAAIAERPNVKFQGFQFHTALIRDIFELQGGKIRLTGFWTQAAEFRNSHPDRVVPFGRRVCKDFEGGAHCARGLRKWRLLYTTRHIDGHATGGRLKVCKGPSNSRVDKN
jgi:hypothetical protein